MTGISVGDRLRYRDGSIWTVHGIRADSEGNPTYLVTTPSPSGGAWWQTEGAKKIQRHYVKVEGE